MLASSHHEGSSVHTRFKGNRIEACAPASPGARTTSRTRTRQGASLDRYSASVISMVSPARASSASAASLLRYTSLARSLSRPTGPDGPSI